MHGATCLPAATPTRIQKELEPLFISALIVHTIAVLFMALFLLPGLPGGGHDLSGRMSYVSMHPWLWRFGWLPWHVAAVADALISWTLMRQKGMPRLYAILTALFTLAAVVPDQIAQVLWVTKGVVLAATQSAPAYARFEIQVFSLLAGYGATFYALMAVGWCRSLVTLGIWHRALSWPSVLLWSALGLSGVGVLQPHLVPTSLVVAINAVGFAGLLCWFAAMTELLLRRSCPRLPHGRSARWCHPNQGPVGSLLNLLANSQLLHLIGEIAPLPVMASDIRDVVYVNYLVEADKLAELVPEKLELQRIGPGGKYALFTFLTYRHGHFGPVLLGPLRKLLPSPVQTNWRVYVQDPRTGIQGVYFVTTAITSTVYALAARILTQGVPMHVLRSADVRTLSAGDCEVTLDPGEGSAPHAEAVLRLQSSHPESGPWRLCFSSYRDMLAYCVPQDRALSSQVHKRRITCQEIALDIPLEACEPLGGSVRSKTVANLVGDGAQPFAFRVTTVQFRLHSQRSYRWE